MRKKLLLFSFLIVVAIVLTGCSNSQAGAQVKENEKNQSTSQVATKQVNNSSEYQVSSAEAVADKVQVFLFHTTHRCSSCIAIGRLAGETVKERFSDELKSGRIEFAEINIDFPENKDLAKKFRASGSSLFINSIYNNQDHIKHNTMVWRLINNPDKFKDYLEGEINILLGK